MDFTKLSQADLDEFLSRKYGVSMDLTLDPIIQAEQLFSQLQNTDVKFPYPIVDLYLASQYTGPKEYYTLDQIAELTSAQLDDLANRLGIDSSGPTQERVYRVLSYLNLIIPEQTILMAPNVLQQLCNQLSLSDLNHYRIANQLSEINCRIKIFDQDRYLTHIDQLTDQSFKLVNKVENWGSLKTLKPLILENDLEGVELLLQHGVPPVHLGSAVNSGNVDLVELLIKYGANPDYDSTYKNCQHIFSIGPRRGEICDKPIKDEGQYCQLCRRKNENRYEGIKPLDQAISNNDLNMIEALLQHGANPDYSYMLGKRLVDFMINAGDIPILNLLLQYGPELEPSMEQAVRTRDYQIINMIYQHYINNNKKIDFGEALFVAATVLDDTELVEHLIDLGADPDRLSKHGDTVLMRSVLTGNIQMVKLLLQYGADPNILDEYDRNALTIVLDKDNYGFDGYEDMAKILVAAGANIDQTDECGHTVLLDAVNTDLEHLAFVIELGANVNFITEDELTPFYVAKINGLDEAAQMLLDAGADPHLTG